MTLTYGSVCSGIESASVAWEPLGWRPKFFSEIEAFPSAVLAHHYGSNLPGEPLSKNGVPNHGDFTSIPGDAGPVDLLVGGTPCQSFSVAGKRLGLDDPRGNLALEYVRLAKRLGARWVVWENVPGVFSSATGRDFADFLGFLTGRAIEVPRGGWRGAGIVAGSAASYGIAWRVLDAQYIRVDGYARAVPQRRRRVVVVGYLGDWRRAAAVLLEPEGMQGHPAPRRKAGQGIAARTARSVALRGRDEGGTAELGDQVADTVRASSGGGDKPHALIGFDGQNLACGDDVFATLDTGAAHSNRGLHVAHTLRGEGFDASEDGTGRGIPLAFDWYASESQSMPIDDHCAPPIKTTMQPAVSIPFYTTQITSPANGSNPRPGDPMHALSAQAHPPAIAGAVVRRLMPHECARLQGFADDRCRIPWKGRPPEKCPDGPQYKAYGNSMAIPFMRWIGMRIDLIERLTREGKIP
ncbi:DNA cytosine methyltransferase [Mesorhizobium ciceri]|uniref:DNA cytosine methyltransferase n=1 Tax=Mesorhizobium TaxID=68287 RepID=UPI0004B3E347|nr:DNA cytosine methyltransferase [Mesorhizobium ciceri]